MISLALFLALFAPVLWAFMNVLDKYIVSHRVKHVLSFAVIAGGTNFLFGALIASLLDWSMVSWSELFWPVLVGLMYGSQFYLYYLLMEQEDAANVVGLAYVYPLLVATLSYLVLGEVLSPIGYLGMAVVILGVVLLSLRLHTLRSQAKPWMLIGIVVVVALGEFFTKVATTELPAWNGIAITNMVAGLCFLPALLWRNIRAGLPQEWPNAWWTLLTEALTLLAIASLFIAMAELPATFVAAIGATQPLIVLVFERMAEGRYGRISRDHLLRPKLVAISLIVLGIIMLYMGEVL